MNPKQKAAQLLLLYVFNLDNAKVCVDEIYSAIKRLEENMGTFDAIDEQAAYWEEVRRELDTLNQTLQKS